jgi:hypothetical protein
MHMRKILKLTVILVTLYIQPLLLIEDARAGAPTTLVEDTGAWFQAVGEGSLKGVHPSLDKVRVWVEGQSGFDQGMDHWYQGMVRVAAGYSITDRLTVWVGYNYLPTENLNYNLELKGINVNGQPVSQQDLWPAIRYNLPTDVGTFIFRTMWESNFGLGSQLRERPRLMIKIIHPLDFEPRLSLIVWDEAFYRINNTSWGGKSGFDQNRAFAGFGWTFKNNIRIELGYMNQYLGGSNYTNSTIHNLGMASVFVDF